jgi:hypothetical protein
MGALFAPKYPRHYTGRHRGPKLWRAARLSPELSGNEAR